ncbi:MAG: hypothetical protein AB1502_09355 [Thermodesulfobacteriota bacterium]
MKVNSTGLGQTTMVAAFTQLFKDPDGGDTLKLRIESSEPIHWVITATLEGADLRNFMKLLLKPSTLYYTISLMMKKRALKKDSKLS